MYKSVIKPFFDVIAAFCGLVILFPLFLIITILLCYSNSGKGFFYQLRTSKKGKIFKIIKFKTMNDKKDKFGNLLEDEIRLTKIGNFVRKFSLDEIPQLWNVLIGQMSFIGPRPLLPEYLMHYSKNQNRRHDVKAGISGWAQVNGRNTISWNEKFELDVFYVDNISFILDIKILILTIINILISKGITPKDKTTMPRFDS